MLIDILFTRPKKFHDGKVLILAADDAILRLFAQVPKVADLSVEIQHGTNHTNV